MVAVVRLVAIERTGDMYVARHEHGVAWRLELRLDMGGTPFRDEIIWPAASVVAVGGGDTVYFLAAETGAIASTLSLGDDLFGHFGPIDGDVLHILGWRHVVAIDKTLAVRWISKDVAVDGIVWVDGTEDRIQLSAEMDPPGGWVDVELDTATGRERSRSGG